MNTNKQYMENVTPRDIADKSRTGNLAKAINFALIVESEAVSNNTQSFNTNRYLAKAKIKNYEDLKSKVRSIKESAIEDLPNLLSQLESVIRSRGGNYFLAKTAEEANEYIYSVCKQNEAKSIVKSKSITSEEIKLNKYLINNGVEVVETDLAEFILQVADEQPSHIVAPAIHRSRESISKLFKENFETQLPLETGEELTKFARDILRDKFLKADIGITGANVIAADSGTLLLVESEGNINMVTQAPPVHIAIAGVEKIIHNQLELPNFIELLAASGTGQLLTSYTHIFRPPINIPPLSFDGREKKAREFHLVLIDNGRMSMRKDKVLREALYCIRCSACMNVCANFQSVGGHAFGGETYSGGIGGSWEAGIGSLENANFSELCTGCSRCVTECPVKIDIPWLNVNIRDRQNKLIKNRVLHTVFGGFVPLEDADKSAPVQKQIFSNNKLLFDIGSKVPILFNGLMSNKLTKSLLDKYLEIDKRRNLPKFTSQTLKNKVKQLKTVAPANRTIKQVLLYNDSFTNYVRAEVGIATKNVFNHFGIKIILSETMNEGRDSLSQGLISTTSKRAKKTVSYLMPFIDRDLDIVVIEPSILALFRKDYNHFIDEESFKKLASKSYDPIEYLYKVIHKNEMDLNQYFNKELINNFPQIFYHSHCQQRSIRAERTTELLFEELGLKFDISTVECCGMAGSFGYKKQFYELSVNVGQNFLDQIEKSRSNSKNTIIVTNGISCHDQVLELGQYKSFHPIEIISQLLK